MSIYTVKWVVCDECKEPIMGAIGTATTAQEARDDARGEYRRIKGRDLCNGCQIDLGLAPPPTPDPKRKYAMELP